MKVKLLKKVRRRFSIVHCPKGFFIGTDHLDYNVFILYDNDGGEYSSVYAQLGKIPNQKMQCVDADQIFNTETECINYLKGRIIRRLISEGHKNAKLRGVRSAQKKVWHI